MLGDAGSLSSMVSIVLTVSSSHNQLATVLRPKAQAIGTWYQRRCIPAPGLGSWADHARGPKYIVVVEALQ